jgi:hypothetical protein
MRRETQYALVVLPMHSSMDTGTPSHILTGAGLSVEEFLALL